MPLRIVAGIGFIIHGIRAYWCSKYSYFFNSLGLPPELAVIIGLLEVIGVLALLLGIVTRIAAILLVIDMIGAIFVVKISKGFIDGFELDLLYLSIMLSLIFTGPGILSIGKNLLKREIFPKK